MTTFIKIAWRNILRNKKRSSITISAVALGLGALIFIWAFVEGAHTQMIENYTSLMTSHLQVHAKGFHQRPQLEKFIDNPRSMLEQLENYPPVKAASLRIKSDGLISSAESSSGVLIIGIDPVKELSVSRLAQQVARGKFLSPEDNDKVIIGDTLAENLNIGLNEKVVVMGQAFDGSIAAGAFYVGGLLDTGVDEVDKGLVLINYTAAQKLLVMGDRASEAAIRLSSAAESLAVSEQLKPGLEKYGYEVLPWQEISVSFLQWIEFDNGFIWIIVIITMIVVAGGILNTILMGVLERTREFGIIMALGTRPRQVIATVAWESVFLGLLGIAFGLAIGLGLTFYFQRFGIDLTVVAGALNSFYMDSVIYPRFSPSYICVTTVLVLIISIIASIYPAWHASRLKPIEAIRSMG